MYTLHGMHDCDSMIKTTSIKNNAADMWKKYNK